MAGCRLEAASGILIDDALLSMESQRHRGGAFLPRGRRRAGRRRRRPQRAFARAIAECGITVASGLALGIDAAAHEGALGTAGSTVAVIGTGPDIVYPAGNRALAHRIAAEGCIVSEYPPGTPVRPDHFPRRNRIISGISQAVLVVEAAAQSGSLITAQFAAEQGRDVFAIPGSIHAALSQGCHAPCHSSTDHAASAGDQRDHAIERDASHFAAPQAWSAA